MSNISLPSQARKVKETYIPPPKPIPFKTRRRGSKNKRNKTPSQSEKPTNLSDRTLPSQAGHGETDQSLEKPNQSNIPSSPANVQESSRLSGTSNSVIDHEIRHAEPAVIKKVLDEHMDLILAAASKEFIQRAAKILEEAAYISGFRSESQNAITEVDIDAHSISNASHPIEFPNHDHAGMSFTPGLSGGSFCPLELKNTDRASTETPSNQILEEQDAHRGNAQSLRAAQTRIVETKGTMNASTLAPGTRSIELMDTIKNSDEQREAAKSDSMKPDENLVKSSQKMEKGTRAFEKREDIGSKEVPKLLLAKERKRSRESRPRKSSQKAKDGLKELTEASDLLQKQDKVSTAKHKGVALPVERPVTPTFAPEEAIELVSPIRSFKNFEEEVETEKPGSEQSFSNDAAEIFKSTLDSIDVKSLLRPAYANWIQEGGAAQISVLIPSRENNDDYKEGQEPGSFPTPPSSQPTEDEEKVTLSEPGDEVLSLPAKASAGLQSSPLSKTKKIDSNPTKRKRATSSFESSGSDQDTEVAVVDRPDYQKHAIKPLDSIPRNSKTGRFVKHAKNKPASDNSSSNSDSDSSLPSLRKVLSRPSSQVSTKGLTKPFSGAPIIDLTSPSTLDTKQKPDIHRPLKKQRFSNSVEVINGAEISPPVTRKSPTPFVRQNPKVSSADFLKRKSSSSQKPINVDSGTEEEDDVGFGTAFDSESKSDLSFRAFDEASPSPNKRPEDSTKGEKDKGKSRGEGDDEAVGSVQENGNEIGKGHEERDGRTKEKSKGRENEGVRKRAKTAPPKISETKQKNPATKTSSSRFLSPGPTTDEIQTAPASISLSQPHDPSARPSEQLSSRTQDRTSQPSLAGQTLRTPTKPRDSQPVKHNLQPTFTTASTAPSFSPYRSPLSHIYRNKKQKTVQDPTINRNQSPNAQRNFTPINRPATNISKSPLAPSTSKSPQTPRIHIRFNEDGLPIPANLRSEQRATGKSKTEKLKRREVDGLPKVNSPTPLRDFVKKECYGESVSKRRGR